MFESIKQGFGVTIGMLLAFNVVAVVEHIIKKESDTKNDDERFSDKRDYTHI